MNILRRPTPTPPPVTGLETVTIARTTHEQRNQTLKELQAQLTTAQNRIVTLDRENIELLAERDALTQTMQRALRILNATIEGQQP